MIEKWCEIWRPVVGYENYLVSSYGRIYSLKRKRTLKTYRDKKYQTVCINRDTKTVHGLVAMAFLGARPEGMVICHNDGDGHNPILTNLRYDTYSGNEADKLKHGTLIIGEQIASSKLTSEQVATIRELHSQDRSTRSLGIEYGVSHTNIRNIVNGVWWKDTA